MPRVTNREAAAMIAQLKPFTSNGAISADYDGGHYVVKSYSTAVAVIYPDDRRAILNTARYSVTTSKHQGITALGVSRLGYEEEAIDNPEQFTTLTGYRARLRGANFSDR